MLDAKKHAAIINWNGVLQPSAASPIQILNAIIAFSELYLLKWTGWLATLPWGLKKTARAAIITANIPLVIAFYASAIVQNAINQLKLGKTSEIKFFELLLNHHFKFLLTADLSNLEGVPSDLEPKQKAIFLLKRAWCHPRIQDLTEVEKERFKKVMQQFDRVILISNSNTPDIACFIQNLLKANILDKAYQENDIYKRLLQLSTPGDPITTIETMLLELNDTVSILASPFTHEWKVQTGKLAETTGSTGFLPRLLEAMANEYISTLISNAPSDLRCAKTQNATAKTDDNYFQDRTLLQKFTLGAYNNSPIIAALMMGLAIILYLISSFR